MEVDQPSSTSSVEKGKGKEVITTPPNNTLTTPAKDTMNVDESFDASENFLDTNVEAFDRPKKYYFAYFPLDKYPGKFPQQKINDVTDRYFDQYNSFAGVSRGKLPSDPLQQIIKVSFVDITDRDKFCTVEIPNLEKCTFLPLEVKLI